MLHVAMDTRIYNIIVLTFGFALNDDDNCGLFIMYLRTHSVFVQ